MKPIRLISGFLTVGVWTLLSRILGFAREILLAAYVGPGPVMDAFVAAFRLPNMFRRFFAEGAFNAAFVPMFSKKYEGGEDAQKFAQDAFNLLGLAVLALVALAMVFMPALVWLTAEGFSGDERFELTVGFGRILFAYILFMSLGALFSGVLNATGRFAAAAAAPVLLNVFAVLALVIGHFSGGDTVRWLIWVIPLAGIAQLALVWIAADRAGIRIRPGRPRWTADMSKVVRIAIPAALSSGVLQINLVVGQQVASRYDEAISWLFIADRLYQLPLGVVGIAVGIVLLPDLSRRLRAGDQTGARTAFSRAGEFALLLTIPAAVAFLTVPLPLVSVLYERGATDASDSVAIAQALAIYSLGLPAFVLQKVLQAPYFAREDTRSPFRFALVAMVVNAALAFGLQPYIGWLAPAVAASASAWAMNILLWIGACRFGAAAQFDSRFWKRLVLTCLSALGMGAVLWISQSALMPMLNSAGWRYLALLLLITIGIISFFTLGQITGAFRLSELKASLKRNPS